MNLHINGRFLVQPISGVQRYAREILAALDLRLSGDPTLAQRLGPIHVWYPEGSSLVSPPDWQVLQITPLPGGTGHAWEQFSLGKVARNGVLASLCGSGPLICRRQLVVIHDANIWTFPEAFSRSYRLFHKMMRPLLARRVTHLATVSQFSAGELARCLRVPEHRFDVIHNSAEHMIAAPTDEGTLTRYGLVPQSYFFAAGNQSPNKNIARLVDALGVISGDTPPLVVAGGFAPGVAQEKITDSGRIRLLGRVSDAELKALYACATAFLWPSLYEGFGIPPLEAMILGTPVLSSSTTAMPEVLGDSVLYFDPLNIEDISAAISQFIAMPPKARETLAQAGKKRAQHYTWTASANALLKVLEEAALA
ncbi:glycosyltransferase family 4 protein [Roseibium sp.]|uniref:glycosyltransferase family 4 protein n=1 Tax=Roseibium sp. TaxID=1936156 RepID=UPI003A97077B